MFLSLMLQEKLHVQNLLFKNKKIYCVVQYVAILMLQDKLHMQYVNFIILAVLLYESMDYITGYSASQNSKQLWSFGPIFIIALAKFASEHIWYIPNSVVTLKTP